MKTAKVAKRHNIMVAGLGRTYYYSVGYTAWCPKCTVGASGVNWHGDLHIVGLEAWPNANALADAREHDREVHGRRKRR